MFYELIKIPDMCNRLGCDLYSRNPK